MAAKEDTKALKKKIAELEAKLKRKIEFRVGQKGGVSVYGLGRFPVTLYYEQWIALLDAGDDLRDFLEKNKRQLKTRGNGTGDEDDE